MTILKMMKIILLQFKKKIYEIIKKVGKNHEMKSKKYNADYPTLSESNPNVSKDLDFLKTDTYKKKHESILKFNDFELNDTKNKWFNSTNSELFQTYKENSADEVKGLSLLFPNIGINYIKIAYISFDEEFEITKEFLTDYFKDSYQAGAIIKNSKQIQKEQTNMTINNNKYKANPLLSFEETVKIEDLDPEFKNETFSTLRLKVSKHLKLKMILKKSEKTCMALKNYNEANKFKNLASEQDALLNKFINASKIIFLDKVRRKNNYKEIDLHGLFLEEALDIIADQIKYLKNKLALGLIADCAYKDIKGVKYLKYEIITGKGKNSKNKCPILLPNIKKYLERRKYEFRVVEQEGKIELYLPFY